MSELKVSVEGLAEFSRSLNKFDKDSAKLIRVANNDAAAIFIKKVQPDIPRRTGKARNSLMVRSTRTSVRITVGGSKAPYYPWLDFGGKTGINKSVDRTFYKEGRYIYPGLRKYRGALIETQQKALNEVAKSAGLDVT